MDRDDYEAHWQNLQLHRVNNTFAASFTILAYLYERINLMSCWFSIRRKQRFMLCSRSRVDRFQVILPKISFNINSIQVFRWIGFSVEVYENCVWTNWTYMNEFPVIYCLNLFIIKVNWSFRSLNWTINCHKIY